MSKEVTVRVIMDDSDADATLAKQQTAIDAQAADWRSKRNEILLQMHAINLGISLMVQTIRLAVNVAGQALTPVQNALLSMISSTASIIVATATAMAAGSLGLLTGAALVLAAGAYGFSIAQTAIVIKNSDEMRAAFAAINARLVTMETEVRQRPRGFGF